MKKFFATVLLASAMIMPLAAKEKLNVLYVGGSANIETMGGIEVDPAVVSKSVKERTANFTKFLKNHFTKVTAIQGADYTPEMSANYDVTIFDGRPGKQVKPLVDERDANGRTIKYARPSYVPDDFSDAVVCIANASEDIGRRIGTKNDWYCLCLDNYAFDWDKNHPIFKGPFKVDIKPEMRPAPSGAKEAAPMYGYDCPDELEMWQVAKHSYTDPANRSMNLRIGMVSRPWGYLDSPETEVISGGVSAKTRDAIAIGRHGNFFHWGFAGDPILELTPAGQAALANAIVYAAKFKGQTPIARKYNDAIATRDNIGLKKYMVTKEAWDGEYKLYYNHYVSMDSLINAIKEKQAKGEELIAAEKMYLQFPAPQKPVQVPYSEYIKQRVPNLFPILGEDPEEYVRYYDKNIGYFHPVGERGYDLEIDEQVRHLGIANNDIKMLDKAISNLEEGGLDAPAAKQILERYTLCRFESPKEWRDWYETYKDKMFFTESGGWLWLINTRDQNVPGNDYSVINDDLKPANSASKAEKTLSTKSAPAVADLSVDRDNPVALAGSVVSDEIVLTMNILDGFHAYATLDDEDPFMLCEVSIELPAGVKAVGEIVKPVPKATKNKTTVYEGKVQFKQKVSGKLAGKAVWTVKYQICDNTVCLKPETRQVEVSL